jgi:hypothetical protein
MILEIKRKSLPAIARSVGEKAPNRYIIFSSTRFGQGWKNILNNLRLIIQPVIFFHLITPWLKVFQILMLK